MKSATLAVAALVLVATPVAAQDSQTQTASQPVQVIQTTDAALTCIQISDEAAQLSERMGGDPEGSLFGRLGGVAKAGAAMVIPGAGLVTAAADALTQPGRDRRELAELKTQQRWYYLNGLYAGRRCDAQAEAAMNPPAATPVPAAPVAAVTATTPIPAPAIQATSLQP